MKVLAILLVALALVAAKGMHKEFTDFMTKYNKNYENAEEFRLRFNNFVNNLKKADQLNKLNPRAHFGVNKFSDLSEEEFAGRYLMNFDKKNYKRYPVKTEFSGPKNLRDCNPDQTTYDWNSCGVITSVYNQGQCGSCWAFSATETIESYYALAGNQLTELSMEQIVECDTQGSDQGCNGGFPSGAYQYVESAGGLESLADYPYTSEGGESGQCNFQASEAVATVTGYNSIDGETGLYQQTSSSSGGPVSVCVDASSWQNYNGGVLSSCGTDVDHCVQLTGYTNYGQSGAYWMVRNSWGEDWGQNGYIWISIGEDLCSIGDYATIVSAGPANGNGTR